MIVFGQLLDTLGAKLERSLIQVVATSTSEKHIAGSVVHIQTDDEARYRFELSPGGYDIYAQVSRCSDVSFLGPTVITDDTPNGSINSLVGITEPILPPQVEQVINAANATHANAEKAEIARSAAHEAAAIAQQAVIDSQLAVIDIAKDIAEIQKVIVSLHPMEV